LWGYLLGPIYLAYHGAWGWALVWVVLCLATYGIAAFILPLFAREMILSSYRSRGWYILERQPPKIPRYLR